MVARLFLFLIQMKRQILFLLVMYVFPFAMLAEEYTDPDTQLTYEVQTWDDLTVAVVKGYSGTSADLEIPSSLGGYVVGAIGGRSFEGNNVLTSLTLPNGNAACNLTLGLGCFKDCVNLKKVSIGYNTYYEQYIYPGYGPYMGVMPFEGCSAIEELFIDSNLGYAGIPVNSLKTLTFGDHVTTIANISDGGDGIRQEMVNLESLTIGKNVKEIQNHSFISSSKLSSVVLPEGLEIIGPLAFRNCTNLPSIELPTTLTQIDEEAFADCKSLTNIVIPGSVERVGDLAFAGCDQLEQLVVKEGVKEIGRYTFGECSALKDISLPEGLLVLDGSAFANCYSLTEITIPSTVVAMIEGTFANTSLEKVISYIEEPFSVESIAFSNEIQEGDWHFTTATLYVPVGTKAKYKNTYGWSLFEKVIEMGSIELDCMEEPTDITFPTEEYLPNTVKDNVYYNFLEDLDGYNPEEECIVINYTTDMSKVINGTPGSEDVQLYFNGLIFQVSDKGLINIDCQTLGTNVLNVKVGSEDATTISKDERGIVEVAYDVMEPTYVYVYATSAGGAAPRRVAASENCIKLWSLSVKPGATLGIDSVKPSALANNHYYTLDGRLLQAAPTDKGVYIVNGRKVVVK